MESGSLDKIGREYGLQTEFLKGEINNSKITNYIYNELRIVWKLCSKPKILCVDFVYARHALEEQKMTNVIIKEPLTEDSLGWKCFGLYNKKRKFYKFKKTYEIIYAVKSRAGESLLLTDILN